MPHYSPFSFPVPCSCPLASLLFPKRAYEKKRGSVAAHVSTSFMPYSTTIQQQDRGPVDLVNGKLLLSVKNRREYAGSRVSLQHNVIVAK